jgi:hypothetical protein
MAKEGGKIARRESKKFPEYSIVHSRNRATQMGALAELLFDAVCELACHAGFDVLVRIIEFWERGKPRR